MTLATTCGCAVLAGALLLSCRSAPTVMPTSPPPGLAGAAWVKREALELEADSDPRFASLMESIAKRQVVYLGEPDHYVQEKYAMRLSFIRRLFARGWRRLGMEMGRSDGSHVDAYLASGDETELDKVGIYAPVGVRTPRKGILKGLPPASKRAFVAAEKSFCRELRALSEARPRGTARLRFFGYDVDTDPLAASEQLAAATAGAPPDTAEGRAHAVLARAGTTPAGTLAAELDALVPMLKASGDAPAQPTREDLQALAASWRFAAVAFDEPTNEALVQAHGEREETMFRQLDEALVSSDPILLMGHDMHLSKASGAIRFGARGTRGAASWRTVGTHVAERLGDKAYAIWMLEDHGKHFDVACAADDCAFTTKEDSVEHLLATVGPRFLLPLGRELPAPFDGDLNWQQNGRYASGALHRQVDLIYFVAETTPPHGW